MCCLLSPVAVAQVVPAFELSKKQALQYVRKTHPGVCASKESNYVSALYFQSELFAIDKKYTINFLDSADNKLSRARQKPVALQPARSRCAYDLRFAGKLFDNFMVCEVVPKGDPTFIVTEIYLFRIDQQTLRFIGKKDVNYN